MAVDSLYIIARCRFSCSACVCTRDGDNARPGSWWPRRMTLTVYSYGTTATEVISLVTVEFPSKPSLPGDVCAAVGRRKTKTIEDEPPVARERILVLWSGGRS